MQRQRGELVPIGEVVADLDGPVQAIRGANDGAVLVAPEQPRQPERVQARQRTFHALHGKLRRGGERFMDGDIEEIEQFLNQIELLVQSRSPLGRKTADELFKRLKALEHECENESDKDRLATVQAMLAGYQLSAWLPGGWRNIIMLVIVVFAVLGGVLVHWYWGFLLLLATIFSPRLVGEVMFFLGSLGGGSKSR